MSCCCGRLGFGERQCGTMCTVWRKLLWSLTYNHFTFKVSNQLVYYACHLMAQTQKPVFVQRSNQQVHILQLLAAKLWASTCSICTIVEEALFYICVIITDYPLNLPVPPYYIPICHHIVNMLYCYMKSTCNVQLKLLGIWQGLQRIHCIYSNVKCYSCPCINKQFIYHVGYQNINLTSSWYEPLWKSIIVQPPHLIN